MLYFGFLTFRETASPPLIQAQLQPSRRSVRRPSAGASASWYARSTPTRRAMLAVVGPARGRHIEPIFEVTNVNFQWGEINPIQCLHRISLRVHGREFPMGRNQTESNQGNCSRDRGGCHADIENSYAQYHCSFQHRGVYYSDAENSSAE